MREEQLEYRDDGRVPVPVTVPLAFGCSAVSDSESGCLSPDSDVSFEFGQKRAPARSVRHGACFQLEVQVGGSMKVLG
jgi:hypothetical protein